MTNSSFVGLPEETMLDDKGVKLAVLTNVCPYCRKPLSVNPGLYGLVYYCLKHGDVTRKVERTFGADTEKVKRTFGVSTGEIRQVKASNFPRELQRFSWAAFVFCWIWAIARGLWLWAIIMFLAPFLAVAAFFPIAVILVPACWVLYIWFGFSANRLDWEKGNYSDVHEFRLSHRRWEVFMKWFLAIVIFDILGVIYLVMSR